MATADDISDACQQARLGAGLLFMEMPTRSSGIFPATAG